MHLKKLLCFQDASSPAPLVDPNVPEANNNEQNVPAAAANNQSAANIDEEDGDDSVVTTTPSEHERNVESLRFNAKNLLLVRPGATFLFMDELHEVVKPDGTADNALVEVIAVSDRGTDSWFHLQFIEVAGLIRERM